MATEHPPRVVVGVSGSLSSLAALRRGITEARSRDCPLWAIMVASPASGAAMEVEPLLRDTLVEDARRALRRSIEAALGETPAGAHIRSAVGLGSPGPVLTAQVADGDLLVLGAGDHRTHWWRGRNLVARHCIRHARCPVLVVPPSRLAREVARTGGLQWSRFEKEIAAEVERSRRQ